MPTVRSIMRNAETNEHSFTSLVLGIVQSPQFTQRVKSDPAAATASTTASTTATATTTAAR